jgi:hypothetical protein
MHIYYNVFALRSHQKNVKTKSTQFILFFLMMFNEMLILEVVLLGVLALIHRIITLIIILELQYLHLGVLKER